VLFHDGTKLTSADVKFCLDRARDPKQSWSWTLSAIKSVDAVDPSTIRITLKHPWAPLLSDLSLFDTGIYPMAYFKKVGPSGLSAHPIGTGPYMFSQWVKGQFIRLTKNPNYYLASQYPMQGVEYDLISDSNTRLLKVEGGELDVNYNLAPNLIAQVKSSQTAHVEVNPSTYTLYLIANEQVKPFGDVKVRQAISHAIDRQAMVKILTQGYGIPANSFMPRGAIDYDPNIPVPTYDLALAKKLMSESSVPHGFTMTFETGSGNLTDNQTAVLFQKEMAPLGITVNIKPLDRTTLFNNELVGKYDFANSGWTNDIPDPDELVSWAVDYTLSSKSFLTWYDNPKMISLSQQAEQTTDEATRKQLYYQIQQIWANDQHFWALYYLPYINAVSNHVHGFSENPLGYFNLQGVTKS
jgi:peptide/nickel transport system substrate-binding protein